MDGKHVQKKQRRLFGNPVRRDSDSVAQGALGERTTLEGVLERVVYQSDEDAWMVVRLAMGPRREVTAVGNMLGARPGETVRLTGCWDRNPRHGDQFKVDGFTVLKPSTLMAMEKYLGSGMIPGVGKEMAARLVAHFGLDTLEVIEHQGLRLVEVEGIGPVRSQSIVEGWREQKEIKEVMLFLQSHGITSGLAVKIYKEYGNRAVAIVSENPYQLARDLFGVGFRTADTIASQIGIPSDSPRRVEAGVLHSLAEAADGGHVFLPRPNLEECTATLLEVPVELVCSSIDRLSVQGDIVVEEPALGADGLSVLPDDPSAGLTDTTQGVFLNYLHSNETSAALFIRRLLAVPTSPISIDIERALVWFQDRYKMELASMQKEAVRKALVSKVMVITGGPGTGKTTIINAVIQILEKKGRRILLTAPTGRAAKRLGETTGQDARTVHRLLEFTPRTMSFQRDESNPLDADVLVVDEASMVDTVLLCSLLKAVPPRCQLIFVGDVDQLPSVGPGNVLRDIINSRVVEVVTLTEIFRQAERSMIVVNAHRINRGESPLQIDHDDSDTGSSGETPAGGGANRETDFFFIPRGEAEDVLKTIKFLVSNRIPRKFGMDPIEHVQVLAPMNRGEIGCNNLNLTLQELLNPPGGPELVRGGRVYRVGDKVMQIRNNYDLDVFNGDIGRVLVVDTEADELVVRFEDRAVRYSSACLDELVLAYACSVHKSQGSEYPVVVMPIHTQHYVMLRRNLLYTGITRGKKLVVLVGSRKAVAMAVRNSEVGGRHTRLSRRLAVR